MGKIDVTTFKGALIFEQFEKGLNSVSPIHQAPLGSCRDGLIRHAADLHNLKLLLPILGGDS